MAFWKKWTQEIWFGPKDKEEDEQHVGPAVQSTQQPKKKKKKPKQQKPPEESSKKPNWKDYLLLDRRIRIVYGVILVVIIGLILPMILSYYLGEYRADLGNCNTPTLYRFECLSGSSIDQLTQADCEKADCCWDSGAGTPKCYHKNPTRYTYTVTNVEESSSKTVVDLKPERRQSDMFGNPMASSVRAVVRAVNRHHLIVQLLASGQSEDSFRLVTEDEHTPLAESDFQVNVSKEKKKSFGIVVKRTGTDQVLLDTSYGPLAIGDEYVEMSTTVPSEYIYGLGSERRTSFKRSFNYVKTALYNRQGADSYNPFYMAVDPASGNFHGVFWDNPYPLEIQFSPVPAIAYRSMGGSGVFHLFSGPTPADVSKQFTADIVGPAPMPPFWSLGFHLCRESDNSSVFTDTFQQMLNDNIGFDSDCIDQRLSGPGAGSFDVDRFPDSANQRDDLLRNNGKKFVLAQPPHVVNVEQFPENRWVLHNKSTTDYETGNRAGSVVYYPSYPATSQLNWDAMLQPEGFNLLDNWPSNEGNSNCPNRLRSFIPNNIRSSISNNTLCLDAYHPNPDQEGLEHFAVHNHYGVQQLKYYLDQVYGKRLLFLNRAVALGNFGKAGYPGDDYTSSWTSMKTALVQVLEMGLFGVTLAGAPICGAVNDTSFGSFATLDEEQLCTRWYQMGLLLPFAHSTTKLNHRLRSPVDWSLFSRRIFSGYIAQRYRLLPYFYTLFYQASTEGTPVVRPMWYQFPTDNETYPLSEQFMIGASIMVAPVMIQADDTDSLTRSTIYFPSGTWYDYYTGEWLCSNAKGQGVVVATGLYHVNMFVVNDAVFVTQEPGSSAEQTRSNPYIVTVAFPITSPTAQGRLYVDDGSSLDQSAHDLILFDFTHDTFTMQRNHSGFVPTDDVSTVVDSVRILGLDLKDSQIPPGADYNIYTKVLEFKNLGFDWTKSDTYTLIFKL